MKKIVFCFALVLLFIGGCQTNAATEEEPKQEKEEITAELSGEAQDPMRFLTETFGLDEAELAPYDLESLIEDYQLRTLDFTADEIREILRDYGDAYPNNGVRQALRLLDAEEGQLLKRDDDVRRIGFSYNSGTFFRQMVFDRANGQLYVEGAEPAPLTEEELQLLEDVLAADTIYSWQSHYEGEEEPTTGNFAWKLVFELDDGSRCAYGGYTQDMTHLPDGLTGISDTLLSIASSHVPVT